MQNYIPKAGDVVSTPEVAFPMTVESVNAETRLCALVGFNPENNELVTLPRVCMMEVQPAEATAA